MKTDVWHEKAQEFRKYVDVREALGNNHTDLILFPLSLSLSPIEGTFHICSFQIYGYSEEAMLVLILLQ